MLSNFILNRNLKHFTQWNLNLVLKLINNHKEIAQSLIYNAFKPLLQNFQDLCMRSCQWSDTGINLICPNMTKRAARVMRVLTSNFYPLSF